MRQLRRHFSAPGLRLARARWAKRQINRRPSALLARSLPWLSVMAGSLASALLWIASAPIIPPLGLLALIAWRQVRPGLLPVWAGFPLGAFDDLYSGQPFGSAVLLWSLVMLALEAIETLFPWRSLFTQWLLAAMLIAATLLLANGIANLAGGGTPSVVVAPQIILSVLAFPLIGRLIAALDWIRLIPFVRVGRWA